jgi:PAS domain S-box-containing protein
MTPPTPQIRSIASLEILEGLARLHPFVLVSDRKGRIEWMSPRLGTHLREDSALDSPADEDLRDSLSAHLPRCEQLEALRDELESGERAGRVYLDIGTRQGARTRVEASAFAVDSGAPDGPHYVVIARPLDQPEQHEQLRHERAREERELQASVGLLSQIVDSSPNGVVATDRSGYITYANPRAALFLGGSKEQLVGRPISVFLPNSGIEGLLEELREPTDWDGEEVERIDESGLSSWMSVSTRPWLDLDRRPVGVITYLRDITQRREMQQELERKNQELESYVDSVAHDLRSPLVAILGFTALLKQDYGETLDETGHHFLDRVEGAGRTMEALIHDLLELSRIRKPGEIVALLDPRSVLLQVEAELKQRLDEHDVSLELPEDPPMMRVDGTRLYQVFANLIGNAVTHGLSDGGGTSRVRVEILERDGYHEIVVSDDGCGVREEDHERIFEVFQTGRGVRRSELSHGIGLAIVKKIAEAHGGHIWVESEPGRGACFHAQFPAD